MSVYKTPIEKIIEQIKNLDLPWEPYKPKEDVIEGLTILSNTSKYVHTSYKKSNGRNVIVGLLDEYFWHLLHWLLPTWRKCSDIDSLEYNGRYIMGFVHYEGFKGVARSFISRIAKDRDLSNYAFRLQPDGSFTVYNLVNDTERDFKTLRGIMLLWNDLEEKGVWYNGSQRPRERPLEYRYRALLERIFGIDTKSKDGGE